MGLHISEVIIVCGKVGTGGHMPYRINSILWPNASKERVVAYKVGLVQRIKAFRRCKSYAYRGSNA